MAIVRKLEKLTLERDSAHKEVEATYAIVTTDDDEKHLQIDTYGSKERVHSGKKSQSIRLTPQAILQLRTIIENM